MNYSHINDFCIKFPHSHPYSSPQISHVKFSISSNTIALNPKFIIPLINTSQSITGQLPSIIKAKKSVASFKLRKNSPLGVFTTLRKNKAISFINLLWVYILPRTLTKDTLSLKKNKDSLNLGYNNVSLFLNLTPLTFEIPFNSTNKNFSLQEKLSNIGGYIQINTKNNNKETIKEKFILSLIIPYPWDI